MTTTTKTQHAYLGNARLTLTSAVCDGEVLDTTVSLANGEVLYTIAGECIADFISAMAAFDNQVSAFTI